MRCSGRRPAQATSYRRPGCGWADIDHSQVNDPRAYLDRVVTRQALNHMRMLSRRREDYVGQSLPEPLLAGTADVAEDVELAESV
jgi:DNA-directed RNA polymerase specialized sigma24 family protein